MAPENKFKKPLEIFLKLFIGADLIVMLHNFLFSRFQIELFIPHVGKRLNNPLLALLIALLALGLVNHDYKEKWFGRLKSLLTVKSRFFILVGILVFSIAFLEGMHLISPERSFWDLNVERGYGTYFSTLQLFFLGLVTLAVLSEAARGNFLKVRLAHWGWVAALFFFLAVDECIGIHDKIGTELAPLIKPNEPGGIIYNAVFHWIWLYGPFIILAAIYLAGFFKNISADKPTVRLYFFSGLGLWVASVFIEIISKTSPVERFKLVALEEGAEMLGATLLIVGFSRYLTRELNPNS